MRPIIARPIPWETRFSVLVPVGAVVIGVDCLPGQDPELYFEHPETEEHELQEFFVFSPLSFVMEVGYPLKKIGEFRTSPTLRPFHVYTRDPGGG